MEIREINEALTMFLEDVAFRDDNIILTNAEIAELSNKIASGELKGTIGNHNYQMNISFSLNCTGDYNMLTPNMKRYINDIAKDGVDRYRYDTTVTIWVEEQDDYELTEEDLKSLCKHVEKRDGIPVITVDIHTEMSFL